MVFLSLTSGHDFLQSSLATLSHSLSLSCVTNKPLGYRKQREVAIHNPLLARFEVQKCNYVPKSKIDSVEKQQPDAFGFTVRINW